MRKKGRNDVILPEIHLFTFSLTPVKSVRTRKQCQENTTSWLGLAQQVVSGQSVDVLVTCTSYWLWTRPLCCGMRLPNWLHSDFRCPLRPVGAVKGTRRWLTRQLQIGNVMPFSTWPLCAGRHHTYIMSPLYFIHMPLRYIMRLNEMCITTSVKWYNVTVNELH